jgi:two-component system, LuxR family, sensor kinase FixL
MVPSVLQASAPGYRHWFASTHLPNALTAVALLLTYIGLEWVSFIHEHEGVPATPWNPGLGVAFAVLVLRGPAYGLPLFVGVLIAEIFVLHTDLTAPIIVAMAAVISASFSAAAVVARRHLQLDVGLSHVRDVLVLLAVGTAAAAMSAVLVSLLLLAADELTIGDLTQSSFPLFVGDIIGIAVMTPLLLRLSLRRPDIAPKALLSLIPELILYLLVIALTLWMIVGSTSASHYKFLPLLFLPVVAASVRHGIDGSCVTLAITQLSLVAVLHKYGHGAAAFTEFQIVMLILTTTGLIVGVVVSERQRADLLARRAETRLKEMQADAASAARMNMVSGMAAALAHEINQPMTAARALARSVQEILRTPKPDAQRADTNLSTLVAQIDHAAAVVRRIREFLRRGPPHFRTREIKSILEDALVLAGPDAAANRITIVLEVDDALPTVFGDQVQLQQVLLNLLHNAVEAILESRRTDGRIGVTAHLSMDGATVEISVVDNGIGIPPTLPLFEPLSSSKKDGLGLGLSICASIIQAHGGRIWLHSGDAGCTEFRVSLPVRFQGGS